MLHVLDHSLPLHSGYSFRSAAILREQRRLGWTTAQVTGPKHPCPATEEQVDDTTYLRTAHTVAGLARVPVINQLDVVVALRRRLDGIVKQFRPHLIHAHSPCLNGMAAAAVARQHQLPFLYELRASWEDAAASHGTTTEGSLRYRLSHALETRVLRSARAVTTICEGLRADVISRGISAERVSVIPNAVDLEHFTATGDPDTSLRRRYRAEGAPLIGFIGSFYAYEGLDLLLQAMPMLLVQYPNARLLLAGGGPEELRLRSLVKDLGITSAVSFAGRIPQAEIPAFYLVMDLMVYPRRRSRLTDLVTPLKPLEAMAQQRLVLASDVGGHRELIVDRKTGFLFPPDDSPALADCVTMALKTGTHDEIRRQARRYVETMRTWPTVVRVYEQVYARAITGAGDAMVMTSQV